MTKVGELITPTGRLVMSAEAMSQNRDGWLEARRHREGVGYTIGASEVPSILDLDGVDTPAHVYRRKVHGIKTPENEAMVFGSLLEPVIAMEWARRNRVDRIDEIGLVARDGDPWAVATIDRRVLRCPVYKETPEGECLCEIKNMGYQTASRFHHELPDRVLAQMLFQLWVTGYKHGHCAILAGGNQLKQTIVYADREWKLTEYVVNEVRKFRTEHLLAGVEPKWDVTRKPEKMIALDEATHPDRIGTLDLDGIGEVMEYASASAAASAAEKARKQQAAVLRQLADGREFVTFSGQPAFRVGETHRTNVNLDKLKEKYPDAYADPEVVSETTSHTIYVDKAYKVRGERS